MANRSKVLIVDDSALMRQLLTQILGSDPDLEIVGAAGDPYMAREKIKTLNPDVLTLDIEMPRMDGLTFLEKLMRGHPMPVVMISSLTAKGADTTLRALGLGAFDYISKPKVDVSNGTIDQAEEIVAKVKAAAKARVRRASASARPAAAVPGRSYQFSATHKIVAVGASTGGTEAPKDLFAFARGLSRNRDCAAYAGGVYAPVCRAAGFALSNTRERGSGRRPCPSRTRLAGSRGISHDRG